MKKKTVTIILLLMTTTIIAQKESIWTVGVHAGKVLGEYESNYSANTGLDLSYLYPLSKKFYLGGAIGFSNYLGKDEVVTGNDINDIEDAQFIPVAASFRLSPFKSILMGGDIGYGIALADSTESGFYASPRLTYIVNDIQIYAGYRLISIEDGLSSLQIGFAYKFN